MNDRDLTLGVGGDELPDGAMVTGRVADDSVLLVRRGAEVHAVGAECPHYHAPLADGLVVDGTIRCPWHHACFDLRSGAILRAPALTPLPVWRVEERDGRWFVGEKIEPTAKPVDAAAQSVVIVGAGAAGVNVALTLRREGYKGSVALISRDSDLPFDKPNLSKDYLAGNAPPEWLPLQPRETFEAMDIDLRLATEVTSIDTSARQVVLGTGQSLSYDALVLATGATPRKLQIPGANDGRVHYLRTQRDAETLAARAADARNVAVIGSSFIGLEAAASLRQRGCDVTVISPDRIPLLRVLGSEVGERIREIHQQHGVKFCLGKTPASITGGEVLLDDGASVPADLIVVGIGVTPSIDVAIAANIANGDAIDVDERFETAMKGVYACGDIARYPDAWSGERIRVEHWVAAGSQGQAVARSILGRGERFSAPPFFWSAHYDVVINYVGHARQWDRVTIDGSLQENDATIAYWNGAHVAAVATIGRDQTSLAVEAAMMKGDGGALDAILQITSDRR